MTGARHYVVNGAPLGFVLEGRGAIPVMEQPPALEKKPIRRVS